MLPVARIRNAPASARLRPVVRWLRERTVPLAAALAWIALVSVIVWWSRKPPVPARVRARAPIAKVQPIVAPEPVYLTVPEPKDTCELDDIFPRERAGHLIGHRRISHRECEFHLPICAGSFERHRAERLRQIEQRAGGRADEHRR